ncbi:hypothetical protein MRX96_032032 [Rhipicephalus microplus]
MGGAQWGQHGSAILLENGETPRSSERVFSISRPHAAEKDGNSGALEQRLRVEVSGACPERKSADSTKTHSGEKAGSALSNQGPAPGYLPAGVGEYFPNGIIRRRWCGTSSRRRKPKRLERLPAFPRAVVRRQLGIAER